MTWKRSRTAGMFRAMKTAVSKLSKGSVLVAATEGLIARIAAITRHSFCYRWLTVEPDPSPAVIDLREARTVGPFVRRLDGVIESIEQASRRRTATVRSALTQSRTVPLLVAVLKPPEPPERDNDTERSNSE